MSPDTDAPSNRPFSLASRVELLSPVIWNRARTPVLVRDLAQAGQHRFIPPAAIHSERVVSNAESFALSGNKYEQFHSAPSCKSPAMSRA